MIDAFVRCASSMSAWRSVWRSRAFTTCAEHEPTDGEPEQSCNSERRQSTEHWGNNIGRWRVAVVNQKGASHLGRRPDFTLSSYHQHHHFIGVSAPDPDSVPWPSPGCRTACWRGLMTERARTAAGQGRTQRNAQSSANMLASGRSCGGGPL